MKNLLEPFGFGFGELQNIANLLTLMERNNISLDDFKVFIEEKRLEMAKKDAEATAHLKKCPICESIMIPSKVNNSPQSMTGDDSKIVHTCMNPECMHQIFE